MMRRSRAEGHRGWQLVTTHAFSKGEVVLGTVRPRLCTSEDEWDEMHRRNSWPVDSILQNNWRISQLHPADRARAVLVRTPRRREAGLDASPLG